MCGLVAAAERVSELTFACIRLNNFCSFIQRDQGMLLCGCMFCQAASAAAAVDDADAAVTAADAASQCHAAAAVVRTTRHWQHGACC